MEQIYYVYEKATGLFAGSGTPFFDDEIHGCVTVPNPIYDWQTQQCHWTGQEWVVSMKLLS